MTKSKEFIRILVPSATVFFSCGCIMILELVASRLIACDLGSSLYTWTSILGIVLAGISAGSYFGGRIADRHHPRRALAVLFGLASAACVGIIVVNNAVGAWTWLWLLNWPAHVFLHVLLVLLVPSLFLGSIAPVVVKTALDRGLAPGRTLGDVYACGAAGAIAGTFLAGFYLISTFGTVMIIWGLGAALLAMAILYWTSCWVMYLWAMVFGTLITMGMAPADWAQDAGAAAMLRRPADPNAAYEDETPYSRIAVRQFSQRPDRRTFVQDKLTRGEVILGDATNLQYFYARIWAALTHGLAENKTDLSMMVLGSGGYAFPQYLQAVRPGSRVEVVEVDPGVTEAAMAAFGLDEDTPIRTVNLDARCYVDRLLQGRGKDQARRYDFIYTDALNDYAVPFYLVTQEFNDKIARLLADDGVYTINLIDTYDNGCLVGAVANTLRQTFPRVYVITSEISLPSLQDTFVVVASKRQIDPAAILAEYNKHLKFRLLDDSDMDYLLEQAGHAILTDDFSPVEHLLTPVVRQGATEILASRRIREAVELQAAHEYEQSIAKYKEAVNLNPSLALAAFKEMGLMHTARDQSEQAVAAFQQALKARVGARDKQATVGEVHMRLGILLDRMNRREESNEQLAKAAESFRIELQENPGFIVVWDWLGEVLAMAGDFKGASDAFAKALALEPANPDHYRKLARSFELQSRYDEAISVVRKHIQLMHEQGNRDMAGQLRSYVDLLEYKKVK
ncbi:MAG: fused MFS/spermidine synthase [Phycisphaerales bacterium]